MDNKAKKSALNKNNSTEDKTKESIKNKTECTAFFELETRKFVIRKKISIVICSKLKFILIALFFIHKKLIDLLSYFLKTERKLLRSTSRADLCLQIS